MMLQVLSNFNGRKFGQAWLKIGQHFDKVAEIEVARPTTLVKIFQRHLGFRQHLPAIDNDRLS